MDKGKACYEMRWMILPAETCSSVQLWVSASNVYTCIWCNTSYLQSQLRVLLGGRGCSFPQSSSINVTVCSNKPGQAQTFFSVLLRAPQTLIIECRPGLWVNSYTSPRLAFTLTARQRLGGQNEFKQLFLNVRFVQTHDVVCGAVKLLWLCPCCAFTKGSSEWEAV